VPYHNRFLVRDALSSCIVDRRPKRVHGVQRVNLIKKIKFLVGFYSDSTAVIQFALQFTFVVQIMV
jgi:hypothetical protein